MNRIPTKHFVLGIDVGGTKLDVQLFQVNKRGISDNPVWKHKYDTVKGVDEHVNQVAGAIEQAVAEAAKLGGQINGVGVASPGRFDFNGTIKPGSDPNLEKTRGEFDGVNLQVNYKAALKKKNPALRELKIFVGNDANAMLSGMIDLISKFKPELHDQNDIPVTMGSLYDGNVALLGIGTGVGHAIVRMNRGGGFYFLTDGHASKLRIAVDKKDWPMVEKAKANTDPGAIMTFNDHTVRAEDLFRAPAIRAMAGVQPKEKLDPNNEEHRRAIDFAGKYMARTIEQIKSGHSVDVEPANGWTDLEKVMAAGTSMYLIGGGIGSSTVGAEIIRAAKDELGTDNAKIRLVQMQGENHAARAAAMLVPEAVTLHRSAKVGI